MIKIDNYLIKDILSFIHNYLPYLLTFQHYLTFWKINYYLAKTQNIYYQHTKYLLSTHKIFIIKTNSNTQINPNKIKNIALKLKNKNITPVSQPP